VLLIAPHVHVQSIVARTQSGSQLLHDSIGRQAESSGSRSTLLSQTEQLYFTADTPFGIGPGGTKAAFQKLQYSYVKMAHDDYAASLVERGLLGGLALVCLLVIVAARCRRIVARGLRRGYASIFPRPELLGAAVIGMFISAMFYQVLHFRHLWALLGVIAYRRRTTARCRRSHPAVASLHVAPGRRPGSMIPGNTFRASWPARRGPSGPSGPSGLKVGASGSPAASRTSSRPS